ncbi:MAG: hypothetical protein GF353_25010 [Candidatus Lokiarchaeota archaeon]|nr:hypothetical protein [Candidatus Lokiarchaeota archaeon]
MIETEDLSKEINDNKKIEILRKNWMSHDARAQMAVVQEFGWEMGNKINKNVMRDIGRTMMYRFMNAVGVKKVHNISDFLTICMSAMKFYYPPPHMNYEFDIISKNEVLGTVKQCAAIQQVKKLGVTNSYECGCFAMRFGWYKALGIKANENCLSCIKDGDSNCKISIKIKKW